MVWYRNHKKTRDWVHGCAWPGDVIDFGGMMLLNEVLNNPSITTLSLKSKEQKTCSEVQILLCFNWQIISSEPKKCLGCAISFGRTRLWPNWTWAVWKQNDRKRGTKNSGQKQTDNVIVDEGAKLISAVLKVNTTLSELCFTRQWWKSMIYERINHLFLLNRKPDGNRRNRCIVWDASGQHNTSKTGNKS